jgi:protein-S-isoprenylcysteine O-methyltransferase Ste14
MPSQSTVGAAATLVAMVLYGALHSILASHRVKRWSHQHFGRSHDQYYRLVFNVIGGLTFLPVLAVVALFPGRSLYSIKPPSLWMSLAVQLLSIVLLLAGLRQTGGGAFLGLSQLIDPEATDEAFTASGPYRWIRHPLYAAGLLFIWAVPRMTTSILALNVGISVYLYVGSVLEERKLCDELGLVYQQYRRQVPRFIPLPGHHFSHVHAGEDHPV